MEDICGEILTVAHADEDREHGDNGGECNEAGGHGKA